MTGEEALKTLIDNAENGYVDIEEVKLVFSELEQEPCEDAISRQDAIRIASGYCHPANIAKELAKLPSVLPEQKKEVLEKIRSEIGQLPSYAAKFAGGASAIHIDKEEVLQIIGKYKDMAESADKE